MISIDSNDNGMNELLFGSNNPLGAFQYFNRNPSLIPTKDQTRSLLNNIKILENNNKIMSIEKVYRRLLKQNVLTNYGAMYMDGPLTDLELSKLESMWEADPSFITTNLGINMRSIDSLKIPNLQHTVTSMQTMTSINKKRTNMDNYLNLFLSTLVQSIYMTSFDPTLDASNWQTYLPFAASLFSLYGVGVCDRLALGEEIKSTLQWTVASMNYMFNPLHKQRKMRHAAATFIVTYLMGGNIKDSAKGWNPSLSETKSKFIHPDAPMIDSVDPMIDGLVNNQEKMNILNLKRTATIQLAYAAIDCIDNTVCGGLNDYTIMLFADLCYRAVNPTYSNIPNEEFPTQLLPSLTLFGFIQSTLILREVGMSTINKVAQMMSANAGVGDIVVALEEILNSGQYMSELASRHNSRLQEEAFDLMSESYVSPIINTIIRSKRIMRSQDQSQVNEDTIEHIPGTTRMYTKNELYLREDAWADEVAQFAKDFMNMKIKQDMEEFGKVLPKTKEEIQSFAAKMLPLMAKKRAQEAVVDNQALYKDMTYDVEFGRKLITEKLQEYGIDSSQVPRVFNELCRIFHIPTSIFTTLLGDIHAVKCFFVPMIEASVEWWNLSGQEMYVAASGINKREYIQRAWDTKSLMTGIPRSALLNSQNDQKKQIIQQKDYVLLRRFVDSEEKMMEERLTPDGDALSQTILSHLQSNMEYLSSPISFHEEREDDATSALVATDEDEEFEMDFMIDLSDLQAAFEKTQAYTNPEATEAPKATNNAMQWDDLINYHQGADHSALQQKDMERIQRIAEIETKLKK